ncbi:MAG: MFS transporter [Solirubrobacteraceae bacterium]
MSSYLRVLRHKDFRFLFLGQSASAVGDQVVIVALALYVTQSTGSATDLGFVLAAQSLPLIGLVLFGGVWADRRGGRWRKPIMIGADVARAALHGLLAVLILLGGATVAEMIVIEALFGAARAFFQPAYSGLVPQTIPDELVQDARALSSSTSNLAILVGPAVGTAMVVTIGAGAAFALDAATFVVSAALLTKVHARPRGATPPRRSMVHDLRDGWSEVRSRPWVWVTIAAFTGAVLCAYAPWYALAPLIARDLYGGAGAFGVLESVAGGGAVLGALIGIRWRPRRPLLIGFLLILVWPVQGIAFALGEPLAAVIVLAFAAGLGFSLFEVWWETALARYIPPHALSRVSSYDWMGSLALMPLGFALAGPLASVLGPRVVLGVGSAFGLVVLGLGLVPRATRKLRGERSRSAEQIADDVEVEAGGEAEVANIDSLVGVVHERPGV